MMKAKKLVELIEKEIKRRQDIGLDDDPAIDLAVEMPGRNTCVAALWHFALEGSVIRLTAKP